ncbi:hypothetical protein ASD11_10810 [Aeromicrobium sp. Root495]|uniref:HtaA domain-containing protein n=1 Tax=Aeromicrobium sp. Root495 TaxID=1736550 RepID=UPI0006F58CDB|nr:HtaA domain-containing protein [Aeromicrobium sp. Root495]KQY59984.1 hypothetical protein ASD11_10810 [Aeromicrobium sp. Root495]
MSSPTWTALDRPTRATLAGGVVVALLLAVVSAVTPASPARAADTGSLVWGVKASFRSYVGGPIAHGSIDVSGGASRLGDGTFSFGQTETSVEAGGSTGTTSFGGGVRFSGHDGQLDVRLASPRLVVTSASAAQLSADVTQAGATTRVVMADLKNPSTSGGATTWKAFLTTAGSQVFALDGSEFYGPGTEIDPVKATVVPLPGPEPTESTATPEPTETTPKPSPTATRPTPRPTPSSEHGGGGGAGGDDEEATTKRRPGLLQWGVKASFRSYITGPIAKGSVAVGGGAAASGGTYRFGQRSSTATPPSAVGTTSYRGNVTFAGHAGLLAMTFADPQVRVTSPSSGSLSVQVGGRRLDVASLALRNGSRSTAGNAVSYSGVPASLTAAGSSLFSYDGSAFYPAGTAMDPVSFVVGSASTVSTSSGSAVVAGGPANATPVSDMAAADTTDVVVAGCAVDDASMTWGFKESFRSYISGSIANGDWATSGQVSYATPSFSFSAGKGTYDGAKGAARLAWNGGIAFTGHDGALDTTVSDPVLQVGDASSATLVLDVKGVSMDDAMAGREKQVERKDVPFVTLDLGAATVRKDGAKVVYEAVPTALTKEGQAAFPNYEAGTAFDPVDLTFTVGRDCASAASDGNASADAAGTAAVQPSAATSDDGGAWLPWVGGGVIGALLVLVGLGGFLLGRRGSGASA